MAGGGGGGVKKPSPRKTAATGSPVKTAGAGKSIPKFSGLTEISPVELTEDGSTCSISVIPTSQTPESGTFPPPTTILLLTCKHLPAMVEFLRMYHVVSRHLRWSKSLPRHCVDCSSVEAPLYTCLQCTHFGCWNTSENHFMNHNLEAGHALAVESISGLVYCCVCRVFVWTDLMKSVWREGQMSPLDQSMTIKKLEAIQAINAEGGYDNCLRRHCISIRGLYNLGNTCFMNSILQTLIHNEPLRRFFLSAQEPFHSTATCNRNREDEMCIACEMDTLFCKMYDGKAQPIAPNRMLEALWRHSKDLAGYEQQDAHELFVTLRNALHSHLGGSMFNCQCIIHNIFSGVLQSDITCLNCGNVTETLDPFLDISLDVPANSDPLGLLECLDRFTRTEQLPVGSYVCEACNQSHPEISKQLTIRSNPIVFSIHLKRFEHGTASTKIDTVVTFNENLSLLPYMANSSSSFESNRYNYRLFAVVSHVGTLDSGHYTCQVKSRGDWFCIDDASVTSCTVEDVFTNGSAYMLFYTQSEFGARQAATHT